MECRAVCLRTFFTSLLQKPVPRASQATKFFLCWWSRSLLLQTFVFTMTDVHVHSKEAQRARKTGKRSTEIADLLLMTDGEKAMAMALRTSLDYVVGIPRWSATLDGVLQGWTNWIIRRKAGWTVRLSFLKMQPDSGCGVLAGRGCSTDRTAVDIVLIPIHQRFLRHKRS